MVSQSNLRVLTFIATALFTLSACSSQKTSTSVYEKSEIAECLADAIPQQFVVTQTNGETIVIHAESEQAFLDGYVTENLDKIKFAEPDYKVRAQGKVSAMDASAADNWGTIRVGADALWAQNVRGAGVIVSVVDTGLDISHTQLSGQIAINNNEIPNNHTDDDGNGLVDDYNGYDFVNARGLTDDNQYHGTHVAGIILAQHNDNAAGAGADMQGIAPDAKIIPLAFLNADGDGNMSDGVKAIKYAVARGARVINASWGGRTCSRSLRDVIATLDEKNVFFVAAAGNDAWDIDRTRQYPASLDLPALFTVGATGDHDVMADYSNYGKKAVHIFAPGTNITSTVPKKYGKLGTLSGTSMAAPFVSGAAALLLSAEPTATNAQLRKAFYLSAYKQNQYKNASLGRLDLRQTLLELRRQMGL